MEKTGKAPKGGKPGNKKATGGEDVVPDWKRGLGDHAAEGGKMAGAPKMGPEFRSTVTKKKRGTASSARDSNSICHRGVEIDSGSASWPILLFKKQ